MALSLDGVSIGYGDMTVIRDLTLKLRAGEVLALVGPNGAGKTTILNGVMGLARVTSGEIRLRGIDVTTLPPERTAPHGVAYVPQGRWLFPYATSWLNVWSGGYPRADRRQVDRDTSAFFHGWDATRPLVSRRGGLLSGGQQQMIAIGRGLLARPRVLLLDEPSVGLAPIAVKEVFAKIAEVAGQMAEAGGAVLVVEQNVAAALGVAKQVCVLVGGAIAYEGPAAECTTESIGDMYLHQAA